MFQTPVSLREFNILSVFLRLLLAMAAAGVLGYGRSRKNRSAGFRTYMLTGIGSALASLLGSYEYEMLTGGWSEVVRIVGMKFDGSRYSAAVIGGIGFLAAGTILSAAHQQVSGLSTAIGLFATAVIGLAAGSGFYEGAVAATLMLLFVLDGLAALEPAFKRRLRNITLYVEFEKIEDLDSITGVVREMSGHVYDIDIERTEWQGKKPPCAILVIQMSRGHASHSEMLSSIAELPQVQHVQELIS